MSCLLIFTFNQETVHEETVSIQFEKNTSSPHIEHLRKQKV